jgi:hypothetical protein
MRKFVMVPALMALACGGDSGVPLDQFPDQYAQAMCAQNFACCTAADIMSRTMQDCVDTGSSNLFFLAVAISDAQSGGRASYDGKQMSACIGALKKMSCADWPDSQGANQPPACRAAVTARVADGGACLNDFECTAGRCRGADQSTTPITYGMCTAGVAVGGSCANGETCAAGAYCEGTGASASCAAVKRAGEACTQRAQCVNSCNTTTGVCSGYADAGCAVAGPLSSPGTPLSSVVSCLASCALLGLATATARRRRRG